VSEPTELSVLRDALEASDAWDFSEVDDGLDADILGHLHGQGYSIVRTEARALLLDELEAAVRERIDTIGVERGRAHAESKHDYEAGVEFAHNLFVGLLALIQQHREAIR
jgi:hypothetical protein